MSLSADRERGWEEGEILTVGGEGRSVAHCTVYIYIYIYIYNSIYYIYICIYNCIYIIYIYMYNYIYIYIYTVCTYLDCVYVCVCVCVCVCMCSCVHLPETEALRSINCLLRSFHSFSSPNHCELIQLPIPIESEIIRA